jgi:hypothetical protein
MHEAHDLFFLFQSNRPMPNQQPKNHPYQDVERWLNGYGYWRPFVVEVAVDPSVRKDPGVHGRYGGELFIPTP